jgi:hypothetical protein
MGSCCRRGGSGGCLMCELALGPSTIWHKLLRCPAMRRQHRRVEWTDLSLVGEQYLTVCGPGRISMRVESCFWIQPHVPLDMCGEKRIDRRIKVPDLYRTDG